MALIDQLRQMYGLDEQDQQIQGMLSGGGGEMAPPGLDPQVAMATGAMPDELPMPPQGGGPSGHPDVMAFIKQMEADGAFAETSRSSDAPKGMHAKSTTVKGMSGGPSDELLAEGVAATRQNELDDFQVEAERALSDSESLTEQASNARIDAELAAEETRMEEQQNAARQERLRSQQEELAEQNDEPINPNRYYENMSIFAAGAAIISAAVHGYQMKGGTPFVVEALQERARQDVQAQIANNAAAKQKREGLIAQYERQYGDTTLVQKRLEADKLHQYAKKAAAEEMDAKSAEKKAVAEDIKKKLQNRVGVIHNEIQQAMAGKPVETSTTFEQNAPKGSGGLSLDKQLALREKMEKLGYSDSEIAAELKKQGVSSTGPSGKSAFKQETELKLKDQELQEAKLRDIPAAEKQKLIERVDGLASATHGFEELDAQTGIKRDKDGEVTKASDLVKGGVGARQVFDAVAGSLPFGIGEGAKQTSELMDSEELKAVRRSVEKITGGMAHAESGAGVSENEFDRYRKRLPLTSAESFKRGSAELFREQKQQYKNLVGQYGREYVDEMLRKRGIDPARYGAR